MTIVYPAGDGAKFDFDYYVNKHMPMVAGFIGSPVVRWEVARGVAAGDGSDAPYAATGQFWIDDLDAMWAAMRQHGPEIMSDIRNYTDITPVVQVEEITKVAEPVRN